MRRRLPPEPSVHQLRAGTYPRQKEKREQHPEAGAEFVSGQKPFPSRSGSFVLRMATVMSIGSGTSAPLLN